MTQQKIREVERAHFRTVHDTGAHPNVLLVWNIVRKEAGLPRLTLDDLDAYCPKCERYHQQPVCEG